MIERHETTSRRKRLADAIRRRRRRRRCRAVPARAAARDGAAVQRPARDDAADRPHAGLLLDAGRRAGRRAPPSWTAPTKRSPAASTPTATAWAPTRTARRRRRCSIAWPRRTATLRDPARRKAYVAKLTRRPKTRAATARRRGRDEAVGLARRARPPAPSAPSNAAARALYEAGLEHLRGGATTRPSRRCARPRAWSPTRPTTAPRWGGRCFARRPPTRARAGRPSPSCGARCSWTNATAAAAQHLAEIYAQTGQPDLAVAGAGTPAGHRPRGHRGRRRATPVAHQGLRVASPRWLRAASRAADAITALLDCLLSIVTALSRWSLSATEIRG